MNFFLNHLNSQCFKKTTNKQKKKLGEFLSSQVGCNTSTRRW